jgi:hypothetical protein
LTITAVGFGTECRTARSIAASISSSGVQGRLRAVAPAMMKPNWWIG